MTHEPRTAYHDIAVLVNKRSRQYHIATSAPNRADRRKAEIQAERLTYQLVQLLAAIPSNKPSRPATIRGADGQTLFLQRERRETAVYVSAAKFNPAKLLIQPSSRMRRLLTEAALIEDAEENTRIIAEYEKAYGKAAAEKVANRLDILPDDAPILEIDDTILNPEAVITWIAEALA